MRATTDQARRLRREATPEEQALWERLRDRQLEGLKFRRQVPIGPFVADFCCPERRVIIELDGEGHREAQQAAYDSERDAYLKAHDYLVLRFPNPKVQADLNATLQEIAAAILKSPSSWLRSKNPKSSFSPSPGEGGRKEAGEGAGGVRVLSRLHQSNRRSPT